MTDQATERDVMLTKLCAAAMGYAVEPRVVGPEYLPLALKGDGPPFYDPLSNDSQALALVKRYPNETVPAMLAYVRSAANVPEMVERATNINRVIVEAISGIQTTTEVPPLPTEVKRAIVDGVADVNKPTFVKGAEERARDTGETVQSVLDKDREAGERPAIAKIDKFFAQFRDGCAPRGCADFAWSAEHIGFGGMYFYVGDDGKVHCGNEIMSKEFLKRMLCKMVDDCVLDEPPPTKEERKST